MASGPITLWQIDGETMEPVRDSLAPWKKSYDQPRQHFKKQRCYFANKAMVFLVVVYGYESWTIKKAGCRRIDAFDVVLEKTHESPLGL